jgi:hypothetical protein
MHENNGSFRFDQTTAAVTMAATVTYNFSCQAEFSRRHIVEQTLTRSSTS